MKWKLLAAASLLVPWNAYAADLGGNCCADLEERVAELEATLVACVVFALGMWLLCVGYMLRAEYLEKRDGKRQDAKNSIRLVESARDRRRASRRLRDRRRWERGSAEAKGNRTIRRR